MPKMARRTSMGRRKSRNPAAAAALLASLAFAAAPGPAAAGDCSPTSSNPQGPFYLPDAPFVTALDREGEPGERIELAGRVYNEPDCEPVSGAVLDIWHANAEGHYYNLEAAAAPADYLFRGRVRTDGEGRFRVRTVRPGSYRTGPSSWRPSHIHVKVSGSALVPLTTQVYLPGDPHLERDSLAVPSLVGILSQRPDGPATLFFDFVLRTGSEKP
jgi:protocatechuate 3,4-dioxygenase beta subunit